MRAIGTPTGHGATAVPPDAHRGVHTYLKDVRVKHATGLSWTTPAAAGDVTLIVGCGAFRDIRVGCCAWSKTCPQVERGSFSNRNGCAVWRWGRRVFDIGRASASVFCAGAEALVTLTGDRSARDCPGQWKMPQECPGPSERDKNVDRAAWGSDPRGSERGLTPGVRAASDPGGDRRDRREGSEGIDGPPGRR